MQNLPFPFVMMAPQQTEGNKPVLEAAMATLQEIAGRYQAKCPFGPGDVVTPRVGFLYTNCGTPHVILEVFDPPLRYFPETGTYSDVASCTYGTRLDVRLGIIDNEGDFVTFCQESWRLERWNSKHAEAYEKARQEPPQPPVQEPPVVEINWDNLTRQGEPDAGTDTSEKPGEEIRDPDHGQQVPGLDAAPDQSDGAGHSSD